MDFQEIEWYMASVFLQQVPLATVSLPSPMGLQVRWVWDIWQRLQHGNVEGARRSWSRLWSHDHHQQRSKRSNGCCGRVRPTPSQMPGGVETNTTRHHKSGSCQSLTTVYKSWYNSKLDTNYTLSQEMNYQYCVCEYSECLIIIP